MVGLVASGEAHSFRGWPYILLGLKRQTLACRRARVKSTKKDAKSESLGKRAGSSSRRKCLSWQPRTSGAALWLVSKVGSNQDDQVCGMDEIRENQRK